MQYDFGSIEKKWQRFWAEKGTFKAKNNSEKEKFYVLDMFPYPSGAGLHVGHPLGYIASDIYARYKRHKGFNVLHPMGYDSFGLPAEQYAIQTGQHPKNTTEINIEGCLDDAGNILSKYVNEDGSIKNEALVDKSKQVTIDDADYRDNIIKGYRRQLDQLGFSFDWSREIRTSNPDYYKWTQWIFIQLFNSWYNTDSDKAEPIENLVSTFAKDGNLAINAVCDDDTTNFSAAEWHAFSFKKKQEILLKYRLTYLADAEVNWCPALGTVLANDEIVNGVSERGGHPVVRKKMTQWMMRITAYAQRLLDGLDTIDWPQPLKDSQANWIGRSEGASVKFRVFDSGSDSISGFRTETSNLGAEKAVSHQRSGKAALNYDSSSEDPNHNSSKNVSRYGDTFIDVFTTRPDTIFGVSFMTLAPEHELVSEITTTEQLAEVKAYVEATAKRSERDRMADVKSITGVFTGAYAEHPFTKEPIPIWIGDYVLAGYGTGAVMSVPCGDQRDYDFAKHFGIDIPNIFEGIDISEKAFSDKEKTVIANSDFLNGLPYKKAVKKAIAELEKLGQGEGKINYRLRDAVFSRQRYWGEPFPVYYDEEGMPQMLEEKFLPLKLPEVDKYLPTETGEPPLGNAKKWHWLQTGDEGKVVSEEEFKKVMAETRSNPPLEESSTAISESVNSIAGRNRSHGGPLELNTMPGWAGSSQYFNRYMDPHNDDKIFSRKAVNYWKDVDLYIGGSEHATGHLLYSRFWQKFMFDKGLVPVDEFAKKLINQGMITGESAFVQRIGFNITFSGPSKFGKKNANIGYGALDYLNEDDKQRLRELREKYAFIKKYFLSDEVISHFKMKNDDNEKSLEIREKLTKFFLKDLQKEIETLGLFSKVNSHFTPFKKYNFYKTRVPVEYVNPKNELNIDKFKNWQGAHKKAELIGDKDGVYIVNREVEKMSKSKFNVVNPDAICEEYGADSLRMYEMFLGPLEQSKPWNTAGITGVHGFLKKLWKLYHSGPNGAFKVTGLQQDSNASGESKVSESQKDNPANGKDSSSKTFSRPSPESLKTLHKTIKKVEQDIENFSFNTSVSTFMICVNELTAQKCTSREILEPLAILISPYAPHIAEELWEKFGHTESIATAPFPKFEEKYVVESNKEYPISFNGKMRFTMELPLDLNKQQIEEAVMAHEKTQQQLNGRTPKKVIVVPGKIVNIVG